MPNSVLVTCPDYDRMTRYISAWAYKFIDEAEEANKIVYVLRDTDVTKDKFRSMITKNKPDLIFINGHGANDRIVGHANKEMVNANSVEIFQGKMVYALSCKSATVLGASCIKKGAKGYVGYSEDFIVVSQPSKTAHPKDDKTAALFLDPSNRVVTSLSKGRSATEAVRKGKRAFAKSIKNALNSDVQSDDDKYIPYLIWNRQHLVAC